MTTPTRSIRHRVRHIIDPLQEELGRLRLKAERLEDQIRQERRRSTRIEEELAFVRTQHDLMVRRRLNREM